MPRKRAWQEMNGHEPDEVALIPFPVSEQLLKIRNMWEFASLMQYIFFFGRAVKINSDLDIEELEMECLNPIHSTKLSEIGLSLLKFVSSHRGLTPDLFDEYTRRQYLAKSPLRNPFGDDEEPLKFSEFDVFTKIRVLHQLSTWTLYNPDRIRERMEEKETEQTNWRIEPLGWDAQERTYFVLDDDRFYRMTDAPPPPPSPAKKKSKSKPKKPKTKPSRVSRRIRASSPNIDSSEEEQIEIPQERVQLQDNGLGGAKWECLAVTLEDYTEFLDSLARTRDPNEKALRKRLIDAVLPTIQKNADEQKRNILRKQRELENLQKLATAKRSGRIAGRMERQREMEEAAEAERKKKEDLAMALKEQERQRKLEAARESRMQTREQRLKDREVKRILHEEELAKLERSQSADLGDGRFSERHLKAEKEKRQRELEKLSEEEEEWYFDCAVCGVHGKNLDDGTQVMQCEKCNVWQHCACHKIGADEAGKDDFHFVCASCLKPKPIKLKLTSPLSSNSERKPKDLMKDKVQKTEPTINGEIITKPKDIPRAKPVVWVQARRPAPSHESSTSPVRPEHPHKEHRMTNGFHVASPPGGNQHQHHPFTEHFSSESSNEYSQYRHSISPPSQLQNNKLANGHNQNAMYQSPLPQTMRTPTLPRLPQMSLSNAGYDYPRQFQHYTPNPRALPSPTESRPSLAATQGNTDVRFSPHQTLQNTSYQHTTTPFDSPSSHGPASSPVKQPSSPIQPHTKPPPSPHQQTPLRAALPIPSLADSTPIAGKGISPVKHDNPRASPANNRSLALPQQPPGHHNQSTVSNSTAPGQIPAGSLQSKALPVPALAPIASSSSPPHLQKHPAPSPGPVSTLQPAPTLSPSQGLWTDRPVHPPVKKPPEGAADNHTGSTSASNPSIAPTATILAPGSTKKEKKEWLHADIAHPLAEKGIATGPAEGQEFGTASLVNGIAATAVPAQAAALIPVSASATATAIAIAPTPATGTMASGGSSGSGDRRGQGE